MPRDTAGNYNLPAGNPVASGEIISASWANSTMNDLGQSLSASLDRYGRGGMLAPFQFTDGTESAPGATWSNEPTTGLYRAAYGDLRFTLTGTDVQRWTNANSYLWRNSQWEEILTQTGGGGDTTINNLVVTGSFTSPGIDDNATSTAITIDANENVGIGIPPSFPLDVAGDNTTIFRATNSSATGTFKAFHEGSLVSLGSVGGSNNELAFKTGGSTGTERMRISASGTTAVTGGFKAAQPGAGAGAFAAGTNAGLTSQGNNGVAIGNGAGKTSQGSSAIAMGYFAGNASQGVYGVAVGLQAGETSQSNYATALGNYAGNSNQGSSAVAVGRDAGQTNQGPNAIAVGTQAAETGQGDSAIALGNNAGISSQGINSVAIGKLAGQTSQGASSVALGVLAGQTNQGANGIIINSSGTASNATQANHILLVSGNNKDLFYNGTDTWQFRGGDVTVPNDSLLVGATNALEANPSQVEVTHSAGNNGIAVKNSSYPTYYYHAVDNTESYAIVNQSIVGVKIPKNGTSWTSFSDENLKENISDLGPVLDTIKDFRCVNYSLKATESETADKVGFIAQDWEHAFPNVVSKDADGTLSMKYTETIPVLLKAMQEQQAMIETLQAEVAALKGA